MSEVNPINTLSIPQINLHDSITKLNPEGLGGIPDQISKAPKNAVLTILEENIKHEKISKNLIQSTGFAIIEDQKKVSKSREEQMKVLREKMMKLQSADTWSAVSDVASYLTTAFNLLLTVNYFNAGAILAGSFLLAAGGIGLGNHFVDSMGGWDKIAEQFTEDQKTQKWLSEYLKTGANYISMGAFLVSCGFAYASGAFQQIADRAGQALSLTGILSTNTTAAISKAHKYQANSAEIRFQSLKDEEISAYADGIVLSSNIDFTTQDRDAIHKKMQAIVLTQSRID